MDNLYPVGYLEIAIGPMFSGKTSWLLEIYNQHTFCSKNVVVINHSEDTRYHETMLSTHDKKMIPCIHAANLHENDENSDLFQKVYESDVVLINEGQFFDGIIDFVTNMLNKKKLVYICGLDGDFKRKKFGDLLDLIPICDKVYKLRSLCAICKNGTRAIFSKRLIDNDSQKVIGSDIYVPVCRKCYQESSKTFIGCVIDWFT